MFTSNVYADAVAFETDWRYGVADSIRGFGSLDPGSNPGTSACFSAGHGMIDGIGDSESSDPVSIPGASVHSTHGGA